GPGSGVTPEYCRFLARGGPNRARMVRKSFAANQPARDAFRPAAFQNPPQRVALAKAFVPCAAEHRMVGNTVFDAELAEPTIGKVHLHLGADTPLRADRKHVANDQHPDAERLEY